jgi:hypothetical protein
MQGTFAVFTLICSMSIPHAECDIDTAQDVIQGPKVNSEMACTLAGQSQLAGTAITPRPGEEYMKIMCKRGWGKDNGG